MLQKEKILDLPFVYTVNSFVFDNRLYIAAGSEKKFPAYIYEKGSNILQKITDGPGGMMSLVHLPGSEIDFFSVMGLFPPFIGSAAGVFFHRRRSEGWSTEKVLSLPFAHRCEIIRHRGQNHLFVASVSRFKADPADWSKPGELHHIMLPDQIDGELKTEILVHDLYRNHGMTKTVVNGIDTICISGESGIYAIVPSGNNSWEVRQLFDREASEFAFFDLDDDGEEELVIIEPFHGNSLSLYKYEDEKWIKYYSSPLSFGHGLSTGIFKNQRVIVVGNRRDSESLEMHVVTALDKVEKYIIEEHAGPTQTKIISHGNEDYILSSNQLKNEVVLYF